MTNIPPVTGRIATIDVIRGIALFGILVMNIQTFSLFAFLRPEQVYDLGLDEPSSYRPLHFFIQVFFHGQFYTIYSFLFGLGFYLLWKKNNEAGYDANRLFRRRLWVLLAIGLIHAFIFWFGDVLHKYALLGFSLIYFNKKSTATILKWIVTLAAFVIICQVISALAFPVSAEAVKVSQQETDKIIMTVVDTWQNGSVGEVFSLQKLGVAMLWFMSAESFFAGFVHFQILFLLGLLAGKLDLFRRIGEFKARLIKIALIILPVAIVLKAIAGTESLEFHLLPESAAQYESLMVSLSYFISVPLLAVVYLIGLSVFLSGRTSGFWRWIGNAGRIGLTNYLAQTLILSLLFYGYAGGLAGNLTLWESMCWVVGIYIFQVLYSNLWLRRHASGPMENLWRKFTKG